MTAEQREAYLKRIGYEGKVKATKECLETLMALHLRNVPFENLEVYEEGKVPSLKSQDIYEKIVLRRRGGYCFELNKLFYELLLSIGFQASPLGVRILWKREEIPPMLHRGTLVMIGEEMFYCDIGYGGPGPKHLVKLEDGIHKEQDGTFRITMHPEGTNGEVLIERKKEDAYLPILRFPLHPAVEADFELMNFYCAAFPRGFFQAQRVMSCNTETGSVALTGNELTIQSADASMVRLIAKTDAEIKEWIRRYFGIED